MYHCHMRLYLTGHPHRVFEIIKEMSPLEHFTHEFLESDRPEETLAAGADVIVADLQGYPDVKEAVRTLISAKAGSAELILLADREQIDLMADDLSGIRDIWTMPFSEEEVRFRFLRWQQRYKEDKDHWQARQYLEAAINNIPTLVWFKDKDGIHEKVNDSFCKTVNKSKEQVEGRGHAYIWDVEQDDPACIESEREVMTKRETCVSEEIIQTGEGPKTLTTYKSPLYDLDGSVMGTVGVAIDATQERAYEQELLRKNRTMETIFTAMECGIVCHSLDGKKVLSINRAALDILGYESKEELEETGFDMIASSVVEEDRENVQELIRSLKKAGDNTSIEYRVQSRNGDILHVMGNVKLLEENGELFYQRFVLDCTEQKLQEKRREMRQAEMIQALGIDYALVCFFDLDTGSGRTLRNDDGEGHVFDPIFDGEVSLQESVERYIQKAVYEEDRETLSQAFSLEQLEKELTEKRLFYMNYRTSRKGKTEYFQMKVVRAGEWEESHGIVLGLRSVDEEIRDEMEKKSLLEDALMQANRASKAKSLFLSNMSHDIRTPMNAIVGFTALAVTHIDNKEQVEEYLKKIMTSGNHLLSLINDVLDMSRIESGKIHLDEQSCNLPEILQGLRNIIQADVHAKQLELYMDAMDVMDEDIYCDKLRLNQVLLNLLGNAVKYTGAGGAVSMRIREKPGAPSGWAHYEFTIKDNGIGMSKEFVAHIIEPFERENTTTISGIPGSGLGMAITKNLVDMMN